MGPAREATIRISIIQAVIFDMDGVVTDRAKAHVAAWKRLFDEYLFARTRRTGEMAFDDDYRRYVDGNRRYDGV